MVEPPEGLDYDGWNYKYAVRGGLPTICDENFEALFAVIPPQDALKLDHIKVNEGKTIYNFVPAIMFTEDEAADISIMENDIKGYVEKKMTEWFVNGGVEEEWESYLNELKTMGLETYVTLYQTGYDRMFGTK